MKSLLSIMLLVPTGWWRQPFDCMVFEIQFDVKDEDHIKGGASWVKKNPDLCEAGAVKLQRY
jgi:hypothetical protein